MPELKEEPTQPKEQPLSPKTANELISLFDQEQDEYARQEILMALAQKEEKTAYEFIIDHFNELTTYAKADIINPLAAHESVKSIKMLRQIYETEENEFIKTEILVQIVSNLSGEKLKQAIDDFYEIDDDYAKGKLLAAAAQSGSKKNIDFAVKHFDDIQNQNDREAIIRALSSKGLDVGAEFVMDNVGQISEAKDNFPNQYYCCYDALKNDAGLKKAMERYDDIRDGSLRFMVLEAALTRGGKEGRDFANERIRDFKKEEYIRGIILHAAKQTDTLNFAAENIDLLPRDYLQYEIITKAKEDPKAFEKLLEKWEALVPGMPRSLVIDAIFENEKYFQLAMKKIQYLKKYENLYRILNHAVKNYGQEGIKFAKENLHLISHKATRNILEALIEAREKK